MVLLSITAGQPCDILSPDLTRSEETYSNMVSSPGTLKTFLQTYGPTLTENSARDYTVRNSRTTVTSSSPSLLRYLKGDIDNQGEKTLFDICLGPVSGTKTLQSIVDTFIIPTISRLNNTYTYTFEGGSGRQSPLTDAEIVTIRNKLLEMNIILKEQELYVADQLQPSAKPTSGQESLLYLYKLSTTELTDTQLGRMKTLETKNLQFFSAFFVEYCLYRGRYTNMLDDYFTYFTEKDYTNNAPAMSSDIAMLFQASAGIDENQYAPGTTTSLSQGDLLKCLAYHMACMKTRMNDMIRILNSINQYYSDIFSKIQEAINDGSLRGSSEELKNSIMLLNDSANESKKYLSEAQFRQGVMEYTQEKNRNANILLGLYAFLNVTALAIIFRVANS